MCKSWCGGLFAAALFCLRAGAQAEVETVWERWSRAPNDGVHETLPALERELFQLLTAPQLTDYLAGVPAEAITLRSGESLAVFLAARNAVGFALPWSSIDGGGGMRSTGGAFAVSGTIGQADAGPTLRGGRFAVTGGFWGVAFDPGPVFSDGFESGDTTKWSSQVP